MSILSPIAASILSSLQGAIKSDSKADGASFLTLLESGKNSAPQAGQADPSVVDTLYSSAPAPAPREPVKETFADAKQPAASEVRTQEKNTQDDARDNSREPVDAPRKAEDTPKKEAVLQPRERSAEKPAAPEKAVAKNTTAQKLSKAEKKTDDDVGETPVEDLAASIRNKINDLNDILSMLASMMGATSVTQVTVQVTQVSITANGTAQGAPQGGLLTDLSDRFQQLMGAISSGQNLPADTKEALLKTFGDFQSLLSGFTGNTNISSVITATTASFTSVSGAPDANPQQLMAAMSQLSDGLGKAYDAISQASTLPMPAPIAEKLKQLSAWAGDFQKLTAPAQVADAPVVNYTQNGALPAVQNNITTAPAPVAQNTALPEVKPANEEAVKEIGAAGNAAASQQPQTTQANNTQPGNASAVAAAISSAAASGNNSFSANTNTGGQGGNAPQTAPVSTGFAAANAATATPASSFAQSLKAASQTAKPAALPVADQVVFNIKTAVKDGARQLEIQLDPAELGKLHIKMDISTDGKASNIVVTAENKSTLDLLQRDARGLQQALSDAGLKTDSGSLSFNLRGENGGQQEDRRPQMAGYAATNNEEDELAPLAVVSRSYVVNTADGLDIQI